MKEQTASSLKSIRMNYHRIAGLEVITANLNMLVSEELVADAHYRWGAMFMGYLLFDTLFNCLFYKHVGSMPFLFHHGLGFACCGFGLYHHKMAVFGISIQAC